MVPHCCPTRRTQQRSNQRPILDAISTQFQTKNLPSNGQSGNLFLKSSRGESPAQIADDFARLIQPLAVTGLIGNFQARHLGLPAALHQFLAILTRMLRIKAVNFQRQATKFLPHLDAKRAGLVLIENNIPALLIQRLLQGRLARDAFRAGEHFPEEEQGAKDDAQGFEKHSKYKFHVDTGKGLKKEGVKESAIQTIQRSNWFATDSALFTPPSRPSS
jgi:hypothetical protein